MAYYKLNGNITKDRRRRPAGHRPADEGGDPDAPKEPENILLIGSDKRAPQNVTADNAGQRSDTTILLHLAADRKSAVLVSIPRDTIVNIPSCKRRDGSTVPAAPATMFNSAFSEAGAACTIKTVEKLTKIRIDHHVVIDFGGFRDMVNALGGVKICLPQSVNDPRLAPRAEQGRAHRQGQARRWPTSAPATASATAATSSASTASRRSSAR